MLAPGRATYEGTHAHVRDAIHEPKGLQQPRIPILVGGNGPKVTWRLAARFADELNLDALTPDRVEAALPVIARTLRRGRPRPLDPFRCRSTSGAMPERSPQGRSVASGSATTPISGWSGSSCRASRSSRTPTRSTTSSTMLLRSGS